MGVLPPTDRIRLNAQIKPTGYIKVEVEILGQGVIEGRSLEETDRFVGDNIASP